MGSGLPNFTPPHSYLGLDPVRISWYFSSLPVQRFLAFMYLVTGWVTQISSRTFLPFS